MLAIVCQSDAEESATAARELVAAAVDGLGGATPRAGLLFTSTEYDHAVLLAALQARWPGLPLIGGTSDGELASAAGFRHDSAVLTLLSGDGFDVHVGVGRNLGADIDAAVDAAMAGLPAQPAVCFTLFAPSTNGSEVVRRLQRRLPPSCPVVGGLSGDHAQYGAMKEFCGGEAMQDSLTVMVLTGDVGVGFGVGSGWFPIGPEYTVTRSDGHIVHTIADRPAIAAYREHWGAVPVRAEFGAYPLAVFPEGLDGPHYLRAVLGADPDTGAIRCAGEVPQGALIRMTEVLPEGVLAGSQDAARRALAGYRGTAPRVAFVFSCAARKWILGTDASKELGLLQQTLREGGVDPALAGFYAFGEIAPSQVGGSSDLHNESCVTVLIGE
ncbi:MAG: FIST C-terminal domain-containing protein [Planctomycetes bacterium]|nr:FIST C-terminal domain-containing protein [Planctomycetota bacterium]